MIDKKALKTWENYILDKTIIQRFNNDYRGYDIKTLRQLERNILDDYKEYCNDIEKASFISPNTSFKEFLAKFYTMDKFTLLDLFSMNELKLIYLPDYEIKMQACKTKKDLLSVLYDLGKKTVDTFICFQDRLVVYDSVMIEDYTYNQDKAPIELTLLYQCYLHLRQLFKAIDFSKKYVYVDRADSNYLLKDNLIVRTNDLKGAIVDTIPNNEKECKELFENADNKEYVYNMRYKPLQRKYAY